MNLTDNNILLDSILNKINSDFAIINGGALSNDDEIVYNKTKKNKNIKKSKESKKSKELKGSKGSKRSKESKKETNITDINNININIIEEKDEIDGYETSNVTLNISGKLINHVTINTLRRVILSLIPIYGFEDNNINITKNTSVFNNDMMRLRLRNFPIYLSKELNKKYIDLKNLDYNQVINHEDTLLRSKNLEYRANLGTAEIDTTINIELLNQDITDNLTIVVNVKNVSENDILNIMTNSPGVKFYLKKEQISHIYSVPLLIIQLQPGQEFACTIKSNINIGMYNASYRCCSLCYFNELDDNSYNLFLHSKRQLSEKDIIIRACEIIKNKIISSENVFIENIKRFNQYDNNFDNDHFDQNDHLRSGTIIIEGEQHTLGNLISRHLQDHKDTTFCGYKVGHPNVNQVDIKYDCDTNILNIIKDICKEIYNIYDEIKIKIQSLPDFGYKYN